ncbi:MAG: response regulator [Ignavibacteriae bacterium]|nr:MAG: response regulator [Ignavibacteriota bacterium]
MTTTPNASEEIRMEANHILKVVDQAIKAGFLDEAKEHLDKAKRLDPTNAYIYAFQERIAFLKEEAAKKKTAVTNRGAMEDAARAKLDADRRRAEEERLKREDAQVKQLEEWHQKKLEAEKRHQEDLIRAAKGQTSPPPAPAPSVSEPVPSVPPEQPRRPEAVYTPPPVPPPAPVVPPRPAAPVAQPSVSSTKANEAHDMYKRVLLLAWADGAISPEEESQLRDLRTSLRITTEEHTQLELEAKEESYAHAFTLVWTSGMNAKERSAVINELRQKYHVSSEAHSRVEAKVLTEFGHHQNKPTLYVIDDDENTLGMIVRVLEGGGFAVHAFNTSDEALIMLQHDMPDLIVSDINLETSTVGGFSFYEKVRQLHHLSHVPFIFLSGMIDEGMVRYGKGLGADDYLTKPFSGEMLLDTIKGKLKRYKQLKSN